MTITDVFRTRELSFATFLATHGIKYLGPEKIAENSYYFTFENPQKCVELEKEFLTFKQQLLKSFNYEKTN